MRLSSPAFANNKAIPSDYSLMGGNISPPLAIDNVPNSSLSLALIVYDPDAPAGDFSHWLVWNLSPACKIIPAGKLPPIAIEGQNDMGNNQWDGPAPPSGTHRYIFKLYSLDNLPDLPLHSTRQELEEAVDHHMTGIAVLTGTFSTA
jgi:hypothetical protein